MKTYLIGIMLIATLLVGCGNSAQVASQAVVNEYMAASEALDLERTLTLYSESIIWEDPGYGDGDGDYFTSKAEVEAMYSWFFSLPDIHLDNTRYFISADGRRATVEWVWSGTHDTGTYTIRGVSILEIEAGKIIHEVIYYDPTTAP